MSKKSKSENTNIISRRGKGKGKGDSYVGEIKGEVRQGLGEQQWDNGEYFIGNFFNDHFHGYGIYKWPNNSFYEGGFYLDQREGPGLQFDPLKEICFFGFFHENERNGPGVLLNIKEKSLDASLWSQGRLFRTNQGFDLKVDFYVEKEIFHDNIEEENKFDFSKRLSEKLEKVRETRFLRNKENIFNNFLSLKSLSVNFKLCDTIYNDTFREDEKEDSGNKTKQKDDEKYTEDNSKNKNSTEEQKSIKIKNSEFCLKNLKKYNKNKKEEFFRNAKCQSWYIDPLQKVESFLDFAKKNKIIENENFDEETVLVRNKNTIYYKWNKSKKMIELQKLTLKNFEKIKSLNEIFESFDLENGNFKLKYNSKNKNLNWKASEFLKNSIRGNFNYFSSQVPLFARQPFHPDVSDCYGNTALILAAFKGHYDILNILLSNGCEVNQMNDQQLTPLLISSIHLYLPFLISFQEEEINHKKSIFQANEATKDYNKFKAYKDIKLSKQLKEKLRKTIILLIKRGADLNITTPSSSSSSPSFFSSISSSSSSPSLTLSPSFKPIPSASSSFPLSPLTMAILKKDESMVMMMISKGADVSVIYKHHFSSAFNLPFQLLSEGITLLELACSLTFCPSSPPYSPPSSPSSLLPSFLTPTFPLSTSSSSFSHLHLSSISYLIIETLVKAGISLKAYDNKNMDPLELLCRRPDSHLPSCLKSINLLIDQIGDDVINQPIKNGNSLLSLALFFNNNPVKYLNFLFLNKINIYSFQLIDFLLEKRIDVDRKIYNEEIINENNLNKINHPICVVLRNPNGLSLPNQILNLEKLINKGFDPRKVGESRGKPLSAVEYLGYLFKGNNNNKNNYNKINNNNAKTLNAQKITLQRKNILKEFLINCMRKKEKEENKPQPQNSLNSQLESTEKKKICLKNEKDENFLNKMTDASEEISVFSKSKSCPPSFSSSKLIFCFDCGSSNNPKNFFSCPTCKKFKFCGSLCHHRSFDKPYHKKCKYAGYFCYILLYFIFTFQNYLTNYSS